MPDRHTPEPRPAAPNATCPACGRHCARTVHSPGTLSSAHTRRASPSLWIEPFPSTPRLVTLVTDTDISRPRRCSNTDRGLADRKDTDRLMYTVEPGRDAAPDGGRP